MVQSHTAQCTMQDSLTHTASSDAEEYTLQLCTCLVASSHDGMSTVQSHTAQCTMQDGNNAEPQTDVPLHMVDSFFARWHVYGAEPYRSMHDAGREQCRASDRCAPM